MTGKTLTLSDTARYLGYSRRTLYNMLNDGRFPVKPIPDTSPRRWNIEDLDAWRAGRYNQLHPLFAYAGIE
jgi:predicted DNA-binding transcriptional regulator AlpA